MRNYGHRIRCGVRTGLPDESVSDKDIKRRLGNSFIVAQHPGTPMLSETNITPIY